MNPTRISLANIAAKIGLSVSTVSLGMRNDSRLRLSTRRKIQAVARELGYRPNPVLAALASRHFQDSSKTKGARVAYIGSWRNQAEDYRRGEALMTTEVQNHAGRLGYVAEIFDVADYRDGAHLSRVLFVRGIQGLLLASLFRPDALAGMDWNPYCVVALGETLVTGTAPPMPYLNRVSVDHFGTVMQAWNETWKRGYRRIGFVLIRHPAPFSDDEVRFGAVAACQERIAADLRVPTLPWGIGTENIEMKIAGWVRKHRPEAVIGFNEWVLACLRREGIRVPEEVGFVTLHTRWGEGLDSRPGSCGMKEMAARRVQAAMELLDQQMRHHQYGLDPLARTQLIHSEWVEGDTLPVREADKMRVTV